MYYDTDYNNGYGYGGYNNGYGCQDNEIEVYQREVYHCIETYAVRRNNAYNCYESGFGGGCNCNNCTRANDFIYNF